MNWLLLPPASHRLDEGIVELKTIFLSSSRPLVTCFSPRLSFPNLRSKYQPRWVAGGVPLGLEVISGCQLICSALVTYENK